MIQYRTSIQHSRTFLFVTSRLLGEMYYLLYADDYEIPSNVATDPEEPSLGRIQDISVAPPNSPTSIKWCVSRVEGNPAHAYTDLFADTESDTPSKEGPISIRRSPCLSPNEPMAIVLRPLIPDGKAIRAKDIYCNAGNNPIKVCFWIYTIDSAKTNTYEQVNNQSNYPSVQRINFFWSGTIRNNGNGNISMRSVGVPSSWVGTDMTGSAVSVPWRLIPADSKSCY